MSYKPVMAFADLWNGEMQGVTLEGNNILLFKWNERVYAYADRCPHQGVQLSQGILNTTTLTCFAHHWEFDIIKGRGINPQAARLMSYKVKVENEKIWVDVDQVLDE